MTTSTQPETTVVAALAATSQQVGGITGSGVKVGIISDSFNTTGGMASDQANGFLPTGSDLTIAHDAVGADEGRAMAQIIHAIAPGASIEFSSLIYGPGVTTEAQAQAAAVQKLQADGCTVIADDLSSFSSPIYQVSDPLQGAIGTAVTDGVSYFSSAGNSGLAFYQGTLAPVSATLPDGSSATANDFGGGQTTVAVTAANTTVQGLSSVNVGLHWNQADGQATDALKAELFDAAGNAITGTTSTAPGAAWSTTTFHDLTPNAQYRLAIVDTTTGSAPEAGLTYRISSGNGLLQFTGLPQGQSGSGGSGNNLVAGENVVAQVSLNTSGDFVNGVPQIASNTTGGLHTIYRAPDGSLLATPEVLAGNTFAAPGGGLTSVNLYGTSVAGTLYPFYGTSAAAPAAAAVAALVVAAAGGSSTTPVLTTADVTHLMADSAVVAAAPTQGNRPGYAGAGLVQADKAVLFAQTGTVTAFDNDAVGTGTARTGNTTLYGTHLGTTFVSDDRADTFVVEGGNNTVSGNGQATVSYADTAGGNVADLSGGLVARGDGSTDHLSGTSGFLGSNGGDTISAGAGSYAIATGTGSNAVFLAGPQATLFSGGSDTVVGSGATTTLFGGPQSTVFSDGGATTFVAGAGTATLVAGAGSVLDFGNAGSQLVFGGSGQTAVAGGTGASTLVGGSGDLVDWAGAGAQAVFGGSGHLWLTEGAGDLQVVVGPGGLDLTVTAGAGGSVEVYGFDAARDHVTYAGFGGAAVASSTTEAGGAHLVLTDGTRMLLA